SFGTEGCGQFDAHSMRSGAFFTSAFARRPTSSYFGPPVFEVSYGAESFTQQRPVSTRFNNERNGADSVSTGSKNFPVWSITNLPGRRLICDSYFGSSRPSSWMLACQPNGCTSFMT